MRARTALIFTLCTLTAPSFAADEMFLNDAARAGLAEVALGQLAAARGSSDSVKRFGRLMIAEHGSANVKLKALAEKSAVQLSTELTQDAKATQTKLASLSGSAFDLAYVESQSQAHAKTVKLLEDEIASGTDPGAKAWAREALPMVTRHGEMVTSLDAMPGEHNLEHALGTPGPAAAPPAPATPR